MGMSLTMAGDYAMRAMIHLASLPEGASALRSEISKAQGIPLSFMAKILRRLVQAELLTSSRGVNGGFSLARPPWQINMLEIVEAIEGPIALTKCAREPANCEQSDDCPASLVWPDAQGALTEVLRKTSLECLVGACRRDGHIAYLSPSLASGESSQPH